MFSEPNEVHLGYVHTNKRVFFRVEDRFAEEDH